MWNLLFGRQHKLVRQRGDTKIVIIFNPVTGRWRKAHRYRGCKRLDTTRDPHVLKGWLTRG